MPAPDLLLAECRHHVAFWWSKAREVYPKLPKRPPKVSWGLRGTSTIGCAYFEEHRIEVNRSMLERDFHGNSVELFAHEVAHLVVHRIHGDGVRHHGKEWKALMRQVFSVEPETYWVDPG